MAQPHERICQRITRRFGSFPNKTYSYRSIIDVNLLITYEERSVPLTYIKRARIINLPDVFTYVGVHTLANIRSCDSGIMPLSHDRMFARVHRRIGTRRENYVHVLYNDKSTLR